MASADTGKITQIQAPELKALNVPSKLGKAPAGQPKYGRTVQTKSGDDIVLGDPDITRGLVALMDQHAVDGGAACHWGGPAAFAEIMSSIHGVMFSVKDQPWHHAYNFINDAGHTENGVYALRANLGFDGMTFEDIKGFRSIKSKFTGHGESHLNPEGVLMSNGPLGSSLPQAQGLALADKALGRSRVTICTLSDGAAMEGEAREALAAIPGWASKGKLNPFVLIISDNNAKLSGRIDEQAFSMKPSFDALDSLGWRVTRVEKGHDLQTVFSAIEKGIEAAKADDKAPVCIVVKTIKGISVQSTVNNASGGHGFPLKPMDGKITSFVEEIFNGNPPAELKQWAEELANTPAPSKSSSGSVPKGKIQVGISTGAIRAVKEGYPVYSISSDLPGSTGMSTFQKTFPDRSLDAGIAESNMINAAAGASKAGLIPIVDTFAQFGVTKGNLPITMAALSQAPIIGVFSHTGFQDAADGASHQATTYAAATGSIPNTILVSLSCADEADAFTYQAVKRIAEERQSGKDGESVLLFLGREDFPNYFQEGASYEWGKAQVLQEGSDIAIVACGSMVPKAIEAAQLLAEGGIKATVINNPFINRPDVDTIGKALAAADGRLITIEDHQVAGGMGALLTHALAQSGLQFRVKSLGIGGKFGQSAYMADELYQKHGMDSKSIAEAAKGLIG